MGTGLLIKDPATRLRLGDALNLLHEPQLLSCPVESTSQMPSHCCAIGVIGRHPAPRRAFESPDAEQTVTKRNAGRRKWPRFRIGGSRSRLARVIAKDHSTEDAANTRERAMTLVSSPCLAGHSLMRLSATSQRYLCSTCHNHVT